MRELIFANGIKFKVKGDGISLKVNGKEPIEEKEITSVLTEEEKNITIKKK